MAVGIRRSRLAAVSALFGALVVAVGASSAAASPFDPSGVIRPVTGGLQLNANQSNNWFGYNQGTLEQGGKMFNAITANWTVPTARQHTKGQAESSATWIGIGGGCIDAGCTLTDPSLIQTGTEQDVSSSGAGSYSAWWELIPVPAVTITNMKVSHGDRMFASIAEATPGTNLWTITIKDLTRHETFSQTTPYPSTHATAEWIEETPLTISSSGTGLAALPNLTETPFDNATVNGANAGLAPSEQIDLTDSSGKVIGTPSNPDATRDGFGACTWTTLCRVPGS
jgi:Peptidase A4 family